MAFRLPRLPRGVRLVDADGTAAQKFQSWWQSVVERIENAINRADGAQMAADQAASKADTAQEAADEALVRLATMPVVQAETQEVFIPPFVAEQPADLILPPQREDNAVAADYLDFGPLTIADAERRIRWDAAFHAPVAGLLADVPVKLGIDSLVLCGNTTGGTIAKGDPVMIAGASGGFPAIAPADPAGYAADLMLGLAAQDIAAGGAGYVMREGFLTGVDTSAFGAGSLLYFASAGGLTASRPAAPGFRFPQALAVTSSASGVIYVRMALIDELNTLRDVSMGTPTLRQMLMYNSGGYWENKTPLLTDMGDATVSGAGLGDILYHDGSVFINTTLVAGANIALTYNGGTGTLTADVTGLGAMAFESTGTSGSFTTVDGKTVTVASGIVTSIV